MNKYFFKEESQRSIYEGTKLTGATLHKKILRLKMFDQKHSKKKLLDISKLQSIVHMKQKNGLESNLQFNKTVEDLCCKKKRFHCDLCDDAFLCHKTLMQHKDLLHTLPPVPLENEGNLHVKKRNLEGKYSKKRKFEPKIKSIHQAHFYASENSALQQNGNILKICTTESSSVQNDLAKVKISRKRKRYTKVRKAPRNTRPKVCNKRRLRPLYVIKRNMVNVHSMVGRYKQKIDKKETPKHLTILGEEKEKTYLAKSISVKIRTKKHKNNIVSNVIDHKYVKKLTVPLIKVEDLPLSELVQLVTKPSYIENRHKYREKGSTPISTNAQNIQYTQIKHYRSIKLRKNKTQVLKQKTKKKSKEVQQKNQTVKVKGKHKYHCGKSVQNVQTMNRILSRQTKVENVKPMNTKRDVVPEDLLSFSRADQKGHINSKQQLLKKRRRNINKSLTLPSQNQNGSSNFCVQEETLLEEQCVNINTCITRRIEMETTNKDENNTKEIQKCKPKSQTIENILHYFLEQKKDILRKEIKEASQMIELKEVQCKEYGMKMILAMCLKCLQVFQLLQQLQDRVNFVKDEKLIVECTLCHLHITSLSHLQQHIMNVHLQCEGTSSSKEVKFPVEVMDLTNPLNSRSTDKFTFECCCCVKRFHYLHDFKEHIETVHCNFNYCTESLKSETENQINCSKLCSVYEDKQVAFSKTTVANEYAVLNIANDNLVSEIYYQNERKNTHIISSENDNIKETEFMTYTSCSAQYDCLQNLVQCNQSYNGNVNDTNLENSDVPLKIGTENQKKNEQHSNFNYFEEKPLKPSRKKRKLSHKHKTLEMESISSISSITNLLVHKRKMPQILLRKRGYPHVCIICFRNFKKKSFLLTHISKHVRETNSQASRQVEKTEVLEGNVNLKTHMDTFRYKQDIFLPNSSVRDTEDYFVNERNNEKLNSAGSDMEKVNQKNDFFTENEVLLNTTNTEDEITANTLRNESICSKTDDLLNCDCTEESESVMNECVSIKIRSNTIKKLKVNEYEEYTQNGSIRNEISTNSITDVNYSLDNNKEASAALTPVNIHCSICHKKFSTQESLAKHIFFLHDSIFEDAQLSNLVTPRFTNNEEAEKMPERSYEDMLGSTFSTLLGKKESETVAEERGKTKSTVPYETWNNKTKMIKKRRTWRCNLCKENFALIRNYLRHKYYIHNDESIVHICDNCQRVLTSVAMVNLHICTNVTSWNCRKCNLNFANGISLTQHNRDYHFETIGPHTCNMCNQSFLTMYMLEKHKSIHCIHNSSTRAETSSDCSSPVEVVDDSTQNVNNVNATDIKNSENQDPCIISKNVNDSIDVDAQNFNARGKFYLPKVNETLIENYTISNFIYLSHDSEEFLKCKFCNLFFLTKLKMKLHLVEQHNINVDICRLCNDLLLVDGLAQHVLNHHIVLHISSIKDNEIDGSVKNYMLENSQNNLLEALNFKRLELLYEYQRFYDVPEGNCINCIVCSEKFLSNQHYKIHYLETHDTMCVLCNIEFNHSFLAMDHKIKIHSSAELYLWTVQQITKAILQLNIYGTTLKDIILKFTEIGT